MFPANLVQATFQQVRHHAARSDTKPAAFKRKLNASFICFCFLFLFFYGQQYRTSSQYIVKPKPTVSQSESTTRRALIYGIQDDNGTDIQNFALDLTPPPDVLIRTREGTSDGMNVLGIVIFSATMGKKKKRNYSSRHIVANENAFKDCAVNVRRYYAGEDGAKRQRAGELLPEPE